MGGLRACDVQYGGDKQRPQSALPPDHQHEASALAVCAGAPASRVLPARPRTLSFGTHCPAHTQDRQEGPRGWAQTHKQKHFLATDKQVNITLGGFAPGKRQTPLLTNVSRFGVCLPHSPALKGSAYQAPWAPIWQGTSSSPPGHVHHCVAACVLNFAPNLGFSGQGSFSSSSSPSSGAVSSSVAFVAFTGGGGGLSARGVGRQQRNGRILVVLVPVVAEEAQQ